MKNAVTQSPDRTAAEWFVELDSEHADSATSEEFNAWLDADPEHECSFASCAAALCIAGFLEDDPDLAWAFAETKALASQSAASRAEARASRHGVPQWLPHPIVFLALAGGVIALLGVARPVGERGGAMAHPAVPDLAPLTLTTAGARADSPVAEHPAAVGTRSVAVLPFENLNTDLVDSFFEKTLARALDERVAQGLVDGAGIPTVSVRPDSPTGGLVPYESGASDVSAFLRGKIGADGDSMWVEAELVDGHSGEPLWSERFYEPLADTRIVGADIVAHVADGLGAPLASAKPDAWGYFVLARRLQLRGNTQAARKAYQEAVGLDPMLQRSAEASLGAALTP